MRNRLFSKGLVAAILIALAVSFPVFSKPAHAGDPVSITINVVGSLTARAVLQSTDFGDLGQSCDNGRGENVSTHECPLARDYKDGPKNMQFMLCIVSAQRPIVTNSCQKLLQYQDNCDENTIWTSTCGLTGGGQAIFNSQIIPSCTYRTQGDAEWTWTLSNDEKNLDCSITGLAVHTPDS